MEIIRLDSSYRGKELVFRYQTAYYYDICCQEDTDGFSFTLQRRALPEPVEKSFTDKLLEPWLEEPRLFAARMGGKGLGLLGQSHEPRDHRMGGSNIWGGEGPRRTGVGSALMERAVEEARAAGARSLVLETQSCNDPAIRFYRKHGFALIGFDLTAYSETDVEKREVRLEFARPV